MASTLNSVPAANSAAGNAVNSSAQNSGRPSLRSSGNSKGDGRRQSGSPVDGGQRYVSTTTAPLILLLFFFCPSILDVISPLGSMLSVSHSIRAMFAFEPYRTPLQPVCRLGARAFKLRELERSCAWNCVSREDQLVSSDLIAAIALLISIP
jgi:hypothetical protein